MKYKHQYLTDNFIPVKFADHFKNGKLKLAVQPVMNTGHAPVFEKQLRFRIKELESANKELQKLVDNQSKELDEVAATNTKFLSIIGHDLRSPFSSIIGVLELLKDSYKSYKITEVKKYIGMAINSTNDAISLLDNILSWAVAQNKAIFFSPVKLNLLDLVIDEFETHTNSAIHKQITLNHDISPGIFINADLQMVKTIFRNLINNAVKYSFVGGEITVSASEGTHLVYIIVQDDGTGISHTAQKELFKTNEIHSTRGTNNENGTGLGLILCKEFVERHGGTIRVISEPGKGSKFIFSLQQHS